MKLNKVLKTAIKYGPIVYPIVKKILNNRSTSKQPNIPRTPKK